MSKAGHRRFIACEDKDAIQDVLCQQYHAVVGGNPPILHHRSGPDAECRLPRAAYSTCHHEVFAGCSGPLSGSLTSA